MSAQKAGTAGSGEKSRAAIHSIPKNVQLTMAVAFVAGLFFIRPYFSTILFSALIAFIFNPVYKATLRHSKRQGLALTVTILAALLSFILPLLLVVSITISQASSLVSKFDNGSANVGPAQVQTVVDRGTDRVNKIVQSLPGGENFQVDKQKARDNLKKYAGELAQNLINVIKQAGGAFFGLISTSILALFLIMGMLRYQTKLLGFVKDLSPFHEQVTDLYLSRTAAMTKAMVKGQLIIATAQGFASAGSLWIVGLGYFWFFFVVLTFLSFIPLGAGIITIPIGVVLMLTGHVVPGLFVILFHILGVSNIDNLLRPRLVPKNARLNSALTLLSVFSGLALFGAPGVVYGPVIMIVLITTFQMYADYNRQVEKQLPPEA